MVVMVLKKTRAHMVQGHDILFPGISSDNGGKRNRSESRCDHDLLVTLTAFPPIRTISKRHQNEDERIRTADIQDIHELESDVIATTLRLH